MDWIAPEEQEVGNKNGGIFKPEFVEVPLRRGFTEIKEIYYTLEDELYHALGEVGAFICGGYARYCASPRKNAVVPAHDCDIYCSIEEAYERLEILFKKELKVRHENNMSLTFERTFEGRYAYCPIVQLIKPLKKARIITMGNVEDVLRNFDFSIVRAAIIDENIVLVDKDFLEDEENSLLRLGNIHCPVSSMLRCMKYVRKGYWMRPMEVLKLFLDWEGRDDEYKSKLAEFLRQANNGKGLSKEQVDELEEMMRID